MSNTGTTIRIGTRGSALARTQANLTASALKAVCDDTDIETVVIRTRGDAVTDRPIERVGGKGVFTKEIEQALLEGRIDLAVHSMKDLPTDLPVGLTVAAVLERDDPRDALVGMTIDQLRHATGIVTIGTGSLRRSAQLKTAFRNVTTVNIRGNVETRIRKAAEGTVDATVLAMAGLRRLGLTEHLGEPFDVRDVMPAPAQGILALQTRIDDKDLAERLEPVNCIETWYCAAAERSVLRCLGGGCHVPVAAYATIENDVLELTARVIAPDGERVIEGLRRGCPEAAEHVGEQLAFSLIDRGADAIIDALEAGEE